MRRCRPSLVGPGCLILSLGLLLGCVPPHGPGEDGVVDDDDVAAGPATAIIETPDGEVELPAAVSVQRLQDLGARLWLVAGEQVDCVSAADFGDSLEEAWAALLADEIDSDEHAERSAEALFDLFGAQSWMFLVTRTMGGEDAEVDFEPGGWGPAPSWALGVFPESPEAAQEEMFEEGISSNTDDAELTGSVVAFDGGLLDASFEVVGAWEGGLADGDDVELTVEVTNAPVCE